jgi:two-component system, OmpR family, alkaline phosphatase synthesis response regulator PhoP
MLRSRNMGNKKILVADDEIHIVQVVAMKLRNNGFEAITADNGLDAYKLCCEEKPSMVITDYQMPGMTGIELIEKIRTTAGIENTPVIVLTARGFAIDGREQERLNISEFLSKPFSPKELLGRVEGILQSLTVN